MNMERAEGIGTVYVRGINFFWIITHMIVHLIRLSIQVKYLDCLELLMIGIFDSLDRFLHS